MIDLKLILNILDRNHSNQNVLENKTCTKFLNFIAIYFIKHYISSLLVY